jgi:hypothetical protein
MSDLRECPFCGGEPRIEGSIRAHAHGVFCSQCPAKIVHHDLDQSKLIAAWQQRQGGWVSVEERLPEKSGYYLAWNPAPSSRPFVVWFDANKQRWESKRVFTHWQPLPAPPEGGDE